MRTLTIDGQVIGTPAYMAPEQARGEKAIVDVRTDVYGLGVILYELLTGSRPFVGSDQMVLVRIQAEDPRAPRGLDAAIPADLETVCLKAMAKEPGRRYASAADLAADLRRYLRGEPVLARPVGRLGTLWRRCRRRPLLSGLAASLVLAVVAGMAGVTWQWRRAEFQRRRAVERPATRLATPGRPSSTFRSRHRCQGSVSPGTRGPASGDPRILSRLHPASTSHRPGITRSHVFA